MGPIPGNRPGFNRRKSDGSYPRKRGGSNGRKSCNWGTYLCCTPSKAAKIVDSDEAPGLSECSGPALTDITAMLLVRLHGVHPGLDPVSLRQASPDPEMVRLMEKPANLWEVRNHELLLTRKLARTHSGIG